MFFPLRKRCYQEQRWIQACGSVRHPSTQRTTNATAGKKSRLENKNPCADCREKIKAPAQGCSAAKNHTFGEEFPHNAAVKDQRQESRVCSSILVWRGCFIILWLITTQSHCDSFQRAVTWKLKLSYSWMSAVSIPTLRGCRVHYTPQYWISYGNPVPQKGCEYTNLQQQIGFERSIRIKAPENLVSN